MPEEGVGDDLFEAGVVLCCGAVHEMVVGRVEEGGEVVLHAVVHTLEVAEFVEQGAVHHEDFFTVVFGHDLEELVGHGFVDEVGNGLVIVLGCPDVAKEVGGIDVAMPCQKGAISTAAEHEVGIELPAKFGPGLGDDAGEVSEAIELFAAFWNIVVVDFTITVDAVLFGVEIVTSGRCDEQRGGLGGGAFIDKVLDEIEELAGLVADGFEEFEVFVAVVAAEVAVSGLVGVDAAAEESEKLVVPSHREGT